MIELIRGAQGIENKGLASWRVFRSCGDEKERCGSKTLGLWCGSWLDCSQNEYHHRGKQRRGKEIFTNLLLPPHFRKQHFLPQLFSILFPQRMLINISIIISFSWNGGESMLCYLNTIEEKKLTTRFKVFKNWCCGLHCCFHLW